MPIPTPTNGTADPAAGTAKTPAQPSQKSLTKAERRELQEKQRAAKLLQKDQQQKQQASQRAPAAPVTKKTQESSNKQQISSSKDMNLASTNLIVGGDDTGAKSGSRALRIFSHFGLPKTVGHVKGDIHPTIIRLGLLFSEFRVCGANARCIATLTAFKTVRNLAYLALSVC